MRLEMDIGNTRAKWRFVDGESANVCAAGVVLTSSLFECSTSSQALSCLLPYIDLFSVESIYIASVVPDTHASLTSWCCDVVGVQPSFAAVTAQCAGVSNGYTDVSQMGVDRWLAILSAYRLLNERLEHSCGCIVVSVGSAMTVDIVLASGKHKGGYIVPGLHMMNNALFHGTGRVKVNDMTYPESPVAGVSTVEAVSAGLPLMLVGLVRLACEELVSYYPSGEGPSCDISPEIYIAGGDGDYIARLLGGYGVENINVAPELVIDGLLASIEGG